MDQQEYFAYVGEKAAGFLLNMHLEHSAVKVPVPLVKKLGLSDAYMFSQILYWHGLSKETGKPRLQHKRDGHLWIVKQYAEWEKEIGLPARTCRQIAARLKEQGLIFLESHFSPFHKTEQGMALQASFIRLNWDTFFSLTAELDVSETAEYVVPETAELDVAKAVTTTDTTTETDSTIPIPIDISSFKDSDASASVADATLSSFSSLDGHMSIEESPSIPSIQDSSFRGDPDKNTDSSSTHNTHRRAAHEGIVGEAVSP